MPSLDDLKNIVSLLNAEEIEYISTFLKSEFDIKLFNLIITNKINEAQQLIDGFKNKKTDKNLSNLYYTILEVPALGICAKYPKIYSPINSARMLIRKNLLLAQYLIAQSQYPTAFQLYNESIAIATKFELYDEILIMLYELDNLYAALQDFQKFNENRKRIVHYEYTRQIMKQAFQIFSENGILKSIFSDNKALIKKQEKYISLLYEYSNRSKSSYVKWVYLRILIDYNETIQNYKTAYVKSRELLEMNQQYLSIHSDGYLAMGNKLCSTYSLCLYTFEEAISFILLAKKFDKDNQHNYNLSLAVEFYIYFHQGNYKKASLVLKEFYSPKDAFTKSTIEYYKACLSIFFSSEYNIIETLSQTKEIEKDKEGWNIYVRLVQIIYLIDSNKNDVATSHVESLRKHIERSKAREIRPRLLLILKVLRELVKNDFNFSETWNKKPDYFELLSSERNLDYSWKILSPELIRFDTWFEAKVRKISYQEVFNEYVKAKQNELKDMKWDNVE